MPGRDIGLSLLLERGRGRDGRRARRCPYRVTGVETRRHAGIEYLDDAASPWRRARRRCRRARLLGRRPALQRLHAADREERPGAGDRLERVRPPDHRPRDHVLPAAAPDLGAADAGRRAAPSSPGPIATSTSSASSGGSSTTSSRAAGGRRRTARRRSPAIGRSRRRRREAAPPMATLDDLRAAVLPGARWLAAGPGRRAVDRGEPRSRLGPPAAGRRAGLRRPRARRPAIVPRRGARAPSRPTGGGVAARRPRLHRGRGSAARPRRRDRRHRAQPGDPASTTLVAAAAPPACRSSTRAPADALAIERSAIGFLVNHRAELERQATLLETRLEQVALGGGGPEGLAAAIAAFLGRPVAIEGRGGATLAVHVPPDAAVGRGRGRRLPPAAGARRRPGSPSRSRATPGRTAAPSPCSASSRRASSSGSRPPGSPASSRSSSPATRRSGGPSRSPAASRCPPTGRRGW